MKAELTYAFDGRVLGVELAAGGHGRDLVAQQATGAELLEESIFDAVILGCRQH